MEIKKFNDLIREGDKLVYFYADWCGKCKLLDLELKKIDLDVLKVNVDEERNICKKYGVMSVPTLIYFKSDGSYTSSSGFISSDEIIKFIKK